MTMTLTPWMNGNPERPGRYVCSAERNGQMHAYFEAGRWSAQFDEAASADDCARARATPLPDDLQGRVEWRGITDGSYRWLTAECPSLLD